MSSEENTEEVFFEIGVGESPGTITKMNDLADKVISTQERIKDSIRSIGSLSQSVASDLSKNTGAIATQVLKRTEELHAASQHRSAKDAARSASDSIRLEQEVLQRREKIAEDSIVMMQLASRKMHSGVGPSREDEAMLRSIVQQQAELVALEERLTQERKSRSSINDAVSEASSKSTPSGNGQEGQGNRPEAVVALAGTLDGSVKEARSFADAAGLTAEQSKKLLKTLGDLRDSGATLKERFSAVRKEFGLSVIQFKAVEDSIDTLRSREQAAATDKQRVIELTKSQRASSEASARSAKVEGDEKTRAIKSETDELERRKRILDALKKTTRTESEADVRKTTRENSHESVQALSGTTGLNRDAAKDLALTAGQTAAETDKLYQSLQRLQQSGVSTTERFKVVRDEFALTAKQFNAVDKAALAQSAKSELDKLVQEHRNASEQVMKLIATVGTNASLAVKGLAQIGLVSEDNSEKLLKSLVAIEGAYNAVQGGIETVKSLADGWKTVSQATETARKIKAATAALVGAEAKASQAMTTALVQETIAANAAALAHQRLTIARSGGSVGKTMSMAGSVAITPAARIAMAGPALAGSASVVSQSTITAASAPAISAIARLTTIATGLAAPVALWGGIIGGTTLGLKVFSELLDGSGKNVGSWTHTIAQSQVKLLDWIGGFAGFDVTGKRRADAAQAKFEENKKKVDAEEKYQSYVSIEKQKYDFGVDKNDDEMYRKQTHAKYGENSNEAFELEQRIVEDATTKYELARKNFEKYEKLGLRTSVEYADALARARHESDRIVEAHEKASKIAKSSGEEQLRTAKSVADAMRKDIEDRRASLKRIEDDQLSAAARFVKLNPIAQQKAISAMGKAKDGRALSSRERELLTEVGTEESKRFALLDAQKVARKSGFDNSFGYYEKGGLQYAQKEILKMEAKLLNQSNISVSIESRNAKLAEELAEATEKAFAKSNQKLKSDYELALSKRLGEYKKEVKDFNVSTKVNHR